MRSQLSSFFLIPLRLRWEIGRVQSDAGVSRRFHQLGVRADLLIVQVIAPAPEPQ